MAGMSIAVYGIAGMLALTVVFSLLALRGPREAAKPKYGPPP